MYYERDDQSRPRVRNRPVANNAEAPAAEVKRGRGRPPVYAGALLAYIVLVISAINRKYAGQGLSKAHDLLVNSGAVRNSYAKKYGVDLAALAVEAELPKAAYCPKISMVTLCQIGKDHGFQFKQGRPHKVAS